MTKFKHKVLSEVLEKKVKKTSRYLKYPFGNLKKDISYSLSEKISNKIYSDTRKQPHLFNIVALRRKWSRKDVIKFVEFLIYEVNKEHPYWKYANSPRIWYNIYCSEKRFVQALEDDDKKKLVKILTTIKKSKWRKLGNDLKESVATHKKTPYQRFYNYRSIKAFFGNKDVPNFEKLVDKPKPQNVKRMKEYRNKK